VPLDEKESMDRHVPEVVDVLPTSIFEASPLVLPKGDDKSPYFLHAPDDFLISINLVLGLACESDT
jgi:hypothetical protein